MTEKKDISKLLDDFFHDRINAEVVVNVLQQLRDEQKLEDIERVMQKHWREEKRTELLEEKEYQRILDGIHHRINRLEEEKSGGTTTRVIRFLVRAAAMLFLPLLFMTAYLWRNDLHEKRQATSVVYNEIYTPLAARARFILPDSTVVWLNSGSTLKYPLAFNGKNREVFLTGEGYFDVAKNPDKPFVIETERVEVTALGTSLDVMAYGDDPIVRTTLIKGKVKVMKKSTGKCVFLEPSMQAAMDTVTGKMYVGRVETRFYTSWVEGKLIFKSEPMTEVAHKLERWFNCAIYIKDDHLRKYRYTGTIEMETLREVLNLMKITTPMKYKYNKDTREVWLEST